ncbi:iron-containing alcohol dehydrogenase [Pseudogemmobacter sp. W21_MBD1_M6]|uniref:iron-containing alcohol dehydrogenase n=1 Tax=Pseudogemmobacter sp. W21_MBD1_M6 TaxID=3240271 RepID=UPI003F946D9E
MISFDFMTSGRIRFGRGTRDAAAPAITALGRRVLLVRGRSVAWVDVLQDTLIAAGCDVVPVFASGEPDLPQLDACVALGRRARVDVVVAVGGGSAIDLAKAAAALIPGPHPAMIHLEVVGEGRPLGPAPLPFIAIPTTSGTGAEVTKNAVITVPDHARKVSLRDDRMVPVLAIIDPALTDNCPRPVTLASGLDAVVQVIEPYLSSKANVLTDALCRDAIPRGLSALGRLMQGEDAAARDDLAFTSLIGGMALANSGLGAVHGLAGVIGGLCGAPHGAICGRLLPAVLIENRAACVAQGRAIDRFDQVAGWIDASLGHSEDAFAHLETRIDAWGSPRLAALNVTPDLFDRIATEAAASSSMRGNVLPLPATTLARILARS